MIFVGVDGGATKTRAMVVDAQGQILGEGRSGACNIQVVQPCQVASFMAAALEQALERAGVAWAHVGRLVVGFAGLDREVDRATSRAVMEELALPVPWLVVNDGVVAWAGALAGEPGLVVISGTGAIALAVNADGQSARSDGWGHWVGDEGSAFDLGRRGIQAVLRAWDGRGPGSLLAQALEGYCAQLGEDDWLAWISQMTGDQGRAHVEIAGFGRVVTEVAEAGDPVARRLVQEGCRRLAQTGWSAARRVGLEQDPPIRVGVAGSILLRSPLFLDLFTRAFQEFCPACTIQRPALQPVEGAALLARRPELVPQDVMTVASQDWPAGSGH